MFSFLLVFSLQSSLTQSLSSPYTSYLLEDTCGQDGSKQSLHLNSKAAIFIFNSTNRRKLDCHLELHLHSKALGFSVFIETLKIERSSGCSRDFLQFGRDKFVITTHTSDRYCDTIKRSTNITDENNALVGYDFKDTSFPRREYIESKDLEMDIWLELEPAQNNQIKEVKLVVAPFIKSCDQEDEEYYKLCPGTSRCFRKQFFCAGVVKCAVLTTEEINKFCGKKTDTGGFMYLFVITIVIVVLIITIITSTLLGCGIKMLLNHFKDNDHHSSETVTFRNTINHRNCDPDRQVQAVTSLLTPERDQRRPASQEIPLELHPLEFPTHPPSYDEVVGIGFKDDPPKYSEITQVLE